MSSSFKLNLYMSTCTESQSLNYSSESSLYLSLSVSTLLDILIAILYSATDFPVRYCPSFFLEPINCFSKFLILLSFPQIILFRDLIQAEVLPNKRTNSSLEVLPFFIFYWSRSSCLNTSDIFDKYDNYAGSLIQL